MGGFAFMLLLIFLLLLTAILLIPWHISKKKIYGNIIKYTWIGVFCLILLSVILGNLTAKKVLTKEDYYGSYIVDRDFFTGKQADWQYENFRFEIKENDKIYFYLLANGKIKETYHGNISTISPYGSERLIIKMNEPNIHILKTNPTIYRSSWNFYLVFNSEKFNNMYFKKGEWKPLNQNEK